MMAICALTFLLELLQLLTSEFSMKNREHVNLETVFLVYTQNKNKPTENIFFNSNDNRIPMCR